MSQYINFYLKIERKDIEWVNVANYSRSYDLYQAAQHYTPFEELEQVDKDWFNNVLDELRARIESIKRQYDLCKNTFDSIKDMNNSVSEKMDAYREIQEYLDEYKDELEYANAALGRILAFQDMWETIPEDTSMWVGIEACPEDYNEKN